MAYTVSTGTRFAISTSTGPAVAVSGISNASPAVITAPGHTITKDAPFLLRTGWEDLNDAVLQAGAIAPDKITLIDEDTTDVIAFPNGSSAGSLQAITDWIELQQVTEINPTGGDQQYAEIQPLSQKYGIKIPTSRSAMSWELTFGWDNKLPGYKAALAASRAGKMVVIRMALPNGGAVSYGFGYITVSETPRVLSNAVTTGSLTLAMQRPLRTYE